MTKTTVFFGDNDVSYIFSVLLSKTKKQKSQISFLVHNMFRSSGPDHMLKKTVFFLLIYTFYVKVNFKVLFGDHKTFHFVRGQQPMWKGFQVLQWSLNRVHFVQFSLPYLSLNPIFLCLCNWDNLQRYLGWCVTWVCSSRNHNFWIDKLALILYLIQCIGQKRRPQSMWDL